MNSRLSKKNKHMPCSACKLLRRRCTKDCIFLPYFPPTEPHKFVVVHRIFGASNITKMLQVSIIRNIILVVSCSFIFHYRIHVFFCAFLTIYELFTILYLIICFCHYYHFCLFFFKLQIALKCFT